MTRNNPKRTLYLGRRAFPPAIPVVQPDSLSPLSIADAAARYPWCARHIWGDDVPCPPDDTGMVSVDCYYESPNGIVVYDSPSPTHPHSFLPRTVTRQTIMVPVCEPEAAEEAEPETEEVTVIQRQSKKQPKISRWRADAAQDCRQVYTVVTTFTPKSGFDPHDMYQVHQLVLSNNGKHDVVQFRIDHLGEQFRLYMRSTGPITLDDQKITIHQINNTSIALPYFPPAGEMNFEVRLNPTSEAKGRRVPITDPHRRFDWVSSRLFGCGINPSQICIEDELPRFFVKRNRKIPMSSINVKFKGRVIDVTVFNEIFKTGIPGKGHFAGFNMLIIK